MAGIRKVPSPGLITWKKNREGSRKKPLLIHRQRIPGRFGYEVIASLEQDTINDKVIYRYQVALPERIGPWEITAAAKEDAVLAVETFLEEGRLALQHLRDFIGRLDGRTS